MQLIANAVLLGLLSFQTPAQEKAPVEKKADPIKSHLFRNPNWTAKVGATCNLVTPSGGPLYVALNPIAYTELKQILEAKDQIGVDKLVASKEAILLPFGTPLILLKPCETSTISRLMLTQKGGNLYKRLYQTETVGWEARITSGPHKDKVAFIRYGNVHQLLDDSNVAKKKAPPKTFKADRPANKASNAFRDAKQLDSSGKIKEAIEAYEALAEEFPNTPEARMANARVKFLGGKP